MSEPTPSAAETHGDASHPKAEGFWALALGSVGVVFGDIGTSPLYAMREALAHSRSGAPMSWRCSGWSPWSPGR